MRDIFDIFKTEIVDRIDNTVKVLTVTNVATTFTVTLCNNKWVRVGQYLTDADNKQWRITEISEAGVITCTKPTGANDIVKRDILTIKEPVPLYGTNKTANADYIKLSNDSRLKLPLVWIVENVTEEEYGLMQSLERRSDIRVYFLDDNNPKQYATLDYRRNVVTPMLGLKDSFIDAVKGNRLFDTLDSWRIRPITRLGNEDEKGVFENILSENLSGVELRITLPIFKLNCNC